MLGSFPSFDGLALYTGSDACTIDAASYTINSVLTAVSMATSGSLTVNNAVAIPLTNFKVSVKVGTQTKESDPFSIEVRDCNSHVSFPNLTPEVIG